MTIVAEKELPLESVLLHVLEPAECKTETGNLVLQSRAKKYGTKDK